MRPPWIATLQSITALLAAVAVVVIGCRGSGPSAPATANSADDAGVRYCVDKGGTPTDRTATWNTNADQAAWLALGESRTFCEFESGSGDATTRISVDLVTLSSEAPTLAGVAYLSNVRTTLPPQPSANPAEWSCATDFQGSAAFGNTVAGGGWVDPAQPVFVVMVPCTFADGSSIDAFGLWYHANGAVRGADLAPLFAYQPGDELPAIYESTRR